MDPFLIMQVKDEKNINTAEFLPDDFAQCLPFCDFSIAKLLIIQIVINLLQLHIKNKICHISSDVKL